MNTDTPTDTILNTSSKSASVTTTFDQLIQLRQVANSLSIFKPHQHHGQQSGDYTAKQHGRGMEFSEVRQYQPGDDVRSMDWKVLARTGEPHTKLFHQERDRPIYLVIDFNPSMFFGTRVTFKSVMAAKTAALLGWAAVNNGDRLGGLVASQGQCHYIKPKSRTLGVLPLLKTIAEATQVPREQQANVDYDAILDKLHHTVKPGGTVILLSDFHGLDPSITTKMKRLAKSHQVFAIFFFDLLEQEAPPASHYLISNGSDKRILNTYQKIVRNQYRDRFESLQSALTQLCLSCNIPIMSLATHQDILSALRKVHL